MSLQRAEGFTLIELLVVIAIIGILAAAAVPQIMDAICDSRSSAAKSNISAIRTAIVQCQMETNCDETDITNMAGSGLVQGGLTEDYSINDTTNTISVTNVGCEWNTSAGAYGMDYSLDNGEFSAP